jgi:hypothetical protein
LQFLSPTYATRRDQFRKLFKDNIPDQELFINGRMICFEVDADVFFQIIHARINVKYSYTAECT